MLVCGFLPARHDRDNEHSVQRPENRTLFDREIRELGVDTFRSPMESPMQLPATYKLAAITVADEDQQARFLSALIDGKSPSAAAKMVGSDELGIMLARCASAEFNDLYQLLMLAKRDNALVETLDKARAASGTVQMVPVLNPDSGEPLLDENFEPIVAPRLVNASGPILAKLLDRLVEAADRPTPATAIQINNSNSVADDLPPMPRLIIPGDDDNE